MGLVNFKSCIRSLRSWLTFSLSFQCGLMLADLEETAFLLKTYTWDG